MTKSQQGKKDPAKQKLRGASVPSASKKRLWFIISLFLFFYGVFLWRLIWFGMHGGKIEEAKGPVVKISTARPDIMDRNGVLLATDIKTYSLFAEPRRITDVDETIELLKKALPELSFKNINKKLRSKAAFVWIQRDLNVKQKEAIMNLGIPGIGFREQTHRFYPSGPTASHILGYVDIDNNGIAGIEKYIDSGGFNSLRAAGLTQENDLKPVHLTLDIRVQAIVREELLAALQRYKAIAAGATVLNIHTGEVLALASVPDFDPNTPSTALHKDRLNRMTAGVYEMGSTIKTFTTAMALDSKKFSLNSILDASKPLQAGPHQVIHDFHGKYRPLYLWEVFIYSSNIGSAKEAMAVGVKQHEAFLKRMGLLTRLPTELPEVARPVFPHPWRPVNSMTISFGHGMMTTPLQTAVGAAALMNGGKWIAPSFIKGDEKAAMAAAKQVVDPATSKDMRYLYKLNADVGSGRKAAIKGYRIGGKTGTAEKVIHGKYVGDKRFNSFLAAFPIDNPQYVVLSIIDEPSPEAGLKSATAAFNAAPIVSNIIRRCAPFLGVTPDFSKENVKILQQSDLKTKTVEH